jgi:hypothetical protein
MCKERYIEKLYLLVLLHGCETWSLVLGKEQFESMQKGTFGHKRET